MHVQEGTNSRDTEGKLYLEIRNALYSAELDRIHGDIRGPLLASTSALARRAFVEGEPEALLAAQRALNVIYMAYLEVPWAVDAVHVTHPLIAEIRYTLERAWEQAEREKHARVLSDLPPVADFRDWMTNYVQKHPSNVTHPIFPFLRDTANFEQMREFFLQETPLELLFGDIIALTMPGIYGPLKVELVKNFWDEVGQAEEPRMHRNMRIRIMEFLQIPADIHTSQMELLVCEELTLINSYLNMATNRAGMLQLLGMLLATEHMIPGRFEMQIDGWRRFGVGDDVLAYLIEHTSVDVEHAEDWMDKVILSLLNQNAAWMPEIVLGALRRLDAAGAVCDRLFEHIKELDTASIGAYSGPIPGSE